MPHQATLPQGRTAIARALESLWEIVGDRHPGRDDPAGLQQLIDRLLDRCPAGTVLDLERRLVTLATVLLDLGPWASDAAVLAAAERRSRQLN